MPKSDTNGKRKTALLLGGAVVALLILGFWANGRGEHTQYLTAPVKRGAITSAVEATGTINPLTTAPVGSSVSGTVKYIFADFNTHVRAGQVLAQLDPDVYEAQVTTARGNLAGAQANLRNLEASLGSSLAAIESGEANAAKAAADLAYARANSRRLADLFGQGLIPLDQRDQSQSTLAQSEAATRAARAQVNQTRAQHREVQAQVEQARAQIEAMRGSLQQAEANLRYCTIVSPTDGIVVARNISVGQSVAASLQAPNLFTIAQDLQRMQVYAKTDESDTGFIKLGGDAIFQVDAFPNEEFHGRVSAIRLNAYIVQNVVTYDTVIDFENPDQRLLPGETAYVSIPTGHVDDTLEIPNAALTYTPDLPAGELPEIYKRFKVPDAAHTTHLGGQQVVWKLGSHGSHGSNDSAGSSSSLEPVAVKVGISDYANTQLVDGQLHERDVLVTGAVTAGSAPAAGKGPPRPPRAPAQQRRG
ncbi:MAG TPA: efflux RND transporter periplasmic adaptor subunit [Thermoanaerobaculia bacterium]|nr:efflux RND transporter periplasmic adaptor subunit [Thermoanaerobaculia bacterium]